MRRAATLAVAMLLPAAAHAQQAAADNKMTWLMPDAPPASIPVDGQPSDGIADQMAHYISARWPERQHTFTYANGKRTWLMLENGDHACFTAALRTPEREKIAYFANTSLVPPIQLVVHEDNAARLPLNARGEVELAKLLASREQRGLLVDKRSYGAYIDDLVAHRPPGSRVEKTAVGDYGRNVMKLVAMGRADYTIDYDYALHYAKHSQQGLDRLRTVPIANNAKLMVAGIACPRNEWGRAAIRRIDQIVGTREGAEAMLKAQNTWHTDAAKQRYAPQLQEFLRMRSRPSPKSEFE